MVQSGYTYVEYAWDLSSGVWYLFALVIHTFFFIIIIINSYKMLFSDQS